MQNSRFEKPGQDRTLASIEAPVVLVLGAGYAGLLAALRIAGKAGSRARVLLVNAGDHFVERVRLHQHAAGQPLPRRSLEHMTRGTGIELIDGLVSAIDPRRKRVEIRIGGELRTIRFDYLLHALGSVGEKTTIPGVDPHAHDISTESGAELVKATLGALPPQSRISVVGGGLTGIEAASEIAETRRDLKVTLIAPWVAPDFSASARAYILEALDELGVRAREGERVVEVMPDGVRLASGEAIESEMTIWCGGLGVGSSALAESFATTARGQLALDATLVSHGFPYVFAAGDGAAVDTPAAGFIRMSCAAAMPMAAHAADNIVRALRGEALEPFGFAYSGRCVSLGRKRGLLQRVSPDDVAYDSVVTGWLGARIKEAVCKYTTLSLAIERVLPGTFTWPGRRRDLAASALLTA